MSNFSENLDYVCQQQVLTQTQLAAELGIGRTVFNKLKTGTRDPTPAHRWRIEQHFRIHQSDFDLAPHKFKKLIVRSNLIFLALRTTQQNIPQCEETVRRYKGQYFIYYPHTDDIVIASLLTIRRATKEGIEVGIVNPHRDSGDKVTVYDYIGYMYPVSSFLYFYLEQKPPNYESYELLSLIIHMPRTPKADVLRGMISGIGVVAETSSIAARPVVLLRCSKKIDDWQSVLGTKLGYLPANSVPKIARDHLSHEKVVIPP